MLTGKALFNTLLAELNEMGLPGMSSTLDEMYRSPNFLELDPLMAIANLVEPEYQKKMNTIDPRDKEGSKARLEPFYSEDFMSRENDWPHNRGKAGWLGYWVNSMPRYTRKISDIQTICNLPLVEWNDFY